MVAGFVYPNELEIQWSLLIVLYPYITGLVAGAFIVSALYHVFGISQLKSVSRMALITSLAFLMVAPLALLVHLEHPERGVEIFFTPHFRSAMAGFGYIWMFYLILLLVEVWLVFRSDIVASARSTQGLKKTVYTVLALGVYNISERSRHIDEKLIKILAIIGIPSAVLLHGYVGFIFGAVKANAWWSSPLMPFIFLLSAIVSGIALLTVMYVVVSKIRKQPIDHACVHTMTKWLAGFLIIDLAFEGLELVSMLYESEEAWDILAPLITDKLRISFLTLQLGLGSLLPFAVLAISHLARLKTEVKTVLGFSASMLILGGVLAMRWNVVIGGQLFSKSLRGFLNYTPELFGKEGVLAAAALIVLPFIIFAVLSYLIPPWKEKEDAPAKMGANFRFR